MKAKLLLALGLAALFSTSALANDRYRERPPVMVSPDLAAPWLMQLGAQQNSRATQQRRVYQQQPRQMKPQVVTGQRNYLPAAPSRPGAGRSAVSQQAEQRQPSFGPGVRRGIFGNSSNVQQAAVRPNRAVRSQIEAQFLPQAVAYDTTEKAGTIVIDTNNRFLYLVQGNGQAMRYGVGVGKPGFEWAGEHRVTRKAEWPSWVPPKEMISREAAKGHYLPARMDGGPENPLGARAMYLGSTLYRIHGTNAPWTIGSAVSSGCIRMRNEDVTDLYGRVDVGTKVIVM
ncbi:Lipoprotein-anchoring transpeptidase ErfK/SrfK [Rhizobium sp. NFR07]|uniref:L,D-transpeptidase n=1 Tax=Rhizobium sp. NFR07 TaxID=1566262 RepID=UPI0008ED7349|nr:L,D-transpeptidase [Rhizobium sp. NFR07]SFB08668.1 Lipoprotein-anchoring transpeptidase ErfK/SrfK [Rhizobium sp. NFR07]